jgi:hypothetical protein
VSRGTALRPGPWFLAFGLVTGLLVVVPELADPVVLRGWALLAALAAAAGMLRLAGWGARSVRPGPSHDDPVVAPRPGPGRSVLAGLAVVLPPTERRAWRAEVAAVLAYTGDRAERRRQVVGFALALPATAACCWRLRLARRAR